MITKKLYKQCVQSILDFNNKELEFYKATNGTFDLVNFDALNELVMRFQQLLEYCTKDMIDTEVGTNLSYFLYELDGGKNYKPGTVTDDSGKELLLTSIEELWENFILPAHPEIEDKEEA